METKTFRMTMTTYNRLKRSIPVHEGETMQAYFDRVSRLIKIWKGMAS